VIDIYKQCFVIFHLSICHLYCSFDGFILSFKNVNLISDIVTLINDDPSLYLDIEADFYIFTPRVGCTLFGK
jgi:hypothetical protein